VLGVVACGMPRSKTSGGMAAAAIGENENSEKLKRNLAGCGRRAWALKGGRGWRASAIALKAKESSLKVISAEKAMAAK